MKLSRKVKLRIIIGIAAIMILYGVLDRFVDLNIDEKVASNVGMVLMIVAFGLLFSRGDQQDKGRGAGMETDQGSGQEGKLESSENTDQLEQTALENDMVKDHDKGATNNDNSRNDLRS